MPCASGCCAACSTSPARICGKLGPAKKKRRFGRYLFITFSVALFGAVLYGFFLAYAVTSEFSARSWDRPAQVYAAPVELYGGRELTADDLTRELVRLGYRDADRELATGRFRRQGNVLEVATRAFDYSGQRTPARVARIAFDGGAIGSISDPAGDPIPIMQLDPLLIGSIFPAHGEDRIVIAPEAVPAMLEAPSRTAVSNRISASICARSAGPPPST